jgi:hypothetical protein
MSRGFYPFVIWSFEHDAWWGPGRMGYVADLAQAGRYPESEANQIVADANRYVVRPNECALPLVDAMDRGAPYCCPRCGAVSFNPHDREHRYCGRCHAFEEL